ncbi:nucleotidyltransferase family protein [Paenibacillus spiritus]|uniref:tRNA(Met) cytidine acetate ligase n=1 Tax=Paenibacillus spiritus TaxID=2496557 RepID=A0A5J5G8U4_9BACL|nr:nucleotidyltransferase family protein [Paenibacillus spiritus]KAA9004137.1 nucleotidyltransferase family protein [Paenibacillus spiritus]
MTTVGIIAEYNPLHNGHVHHFLEAKTVSGADRAVVVMSGPFTQRGEPAIAGKRARTEMALRMGADLVLELPVAYAVQPAEWFGYGAVAVLAAAGIVDSFCFGTESGDLGPLEALADRLVLEDAELQSELAALLGRGMSFPAAYSAAVQTVLGSGTSGAGELLRGSNNALGLHYLIALRRLGAKIRPLTIPRRCAGFHDSAVPGASIASATAVRKLLTDGDLSAAAGYMPDYVLDILEREREQGRFPMHWECYGRSLLHQLAVRTDSELAGIQDVNEGLEHRLRRVLPLLPVFSVGELLDALKAKRYTRTRLQRMLLHILLNHSRETLSPELLARGPQYIRVLGFRESGRSLLREMKRAAALPVVLQFPAGDQPELLLDRQASMAYAAGFGAPGRESLFADYLEPPVRI